MIEPMVFRAIEITFASYMVPALLLPLVWLAAWLRKGKRMRWFNRASGGVFIGAGVLLGSFRR